MSGEQGKGRILWQQVDEVSVLWSLNLQSFPEHKAAHRLLSPKARPSESTAHLKARGRATGKQNSTAAVNKPDVAEAHKEVTGGNSHKFQQGKFWPDENVTVVV